MRKFFLFQNSLDFYKVISSVGVRNTLGLILLPNPASKINIHHLDLKVTIMKGLIEVSCHVSVILRTLKH